MNRDGSTKLYGYEHRNIPPKAVSRTRIQIWVWVRVRVLVENSFDFFPSSRFHDAGAAVGLSFWTDRAKKFAAESTL